MQTQCWLAMASDSAFPLRYHLCLPLFPTGKGMSAYVPRPPGSWTSLAKAFSAGLVGQWAVCEIRFALLPVFGIHGMGTELTQTICSHLLTLPHLASPGSQFSP